MSSVGYAGMPIEHGVHGWWKGYGNFNDVLRELHGPDWQRELFTGPYYSRFVAKTSDGRVVSMNRAPPLAGEPRVAPFQQAMAAMVKQGVLSWADLASVLRFVAKAIGFEHARDYDRWKGVTAGGVADECGVSKRAQAYVLANFSLASAFAPLDRISASAFFSSLGVYVFDAQASLAGKWLRTHPEDELVHAPLCAAIEKHGGDECRPYARWCSGSRDRSPVGASIRSSSIARTRVLVDVQRPFAPHPPRTSSRESGAPGRRRPDRSSGAGARDVAARRGRLGSVRPGRRRARCSARALRVDGRPRAPRERA